MLDMYYKNEVTVKEKNSFYLLCNKHYNRYMYSWGHSNS